jgi:hypothetical protein
MWPIVELTGHGCVRVSDILPCGRMPAALRRRAAFQATNYIWVSGLSKPPRTVSYDKFVVSVDKGADAYVHF